MLVKEARRCSEMSAMSSPEPRCSMLVLSASSHESRPVKLLTMLQGRLFFYQLLQTGDKGDKSGVLTKYFTCLTGSLTYPGSLLITLKRFKFRALCCFFLSYRIIFRSNHYPVITPKSFKILKNFQPLVP